MSDAKAQATPEAAQATDSQPAEGHEGHGHGKKLLPLALGALGIVYGDIGTSPLYAVAECFSKDKFGVTRERIRQIEAKAVRKLQAPARSEELSGFLD